MNGRWRRWWKRGGGLGVAIAALGAAVFGVVLLQAPGHASPNAPLLPLPAGGGTAHASGGSVGPNAVALEGPGLSGQFAFSETAVMAGSPGRVLAELRFDASAEAQAAATRQAVALALVVDVSGSMMGQKIVDARNAMAQMIERMNAEDYVTVVLYDHEVQTLQPLARVGAVRGELLSRIRGIEARGGTVIPPALEVGARNLESAPSHLVRRVVLLSDGQDGSGVPLPQVAETLRSRASRGVSLSALGIGADYDERFMTGVADAGRGNYAYLANGEQLSRFMHQELEEASRTVVDELVATLTLPQGVRLNGVHGAEVRSVGGAQQIAFGPLAAGDRRRAVLDLQVAPGVPGARHRVEVGASYRTVADRSPREIARAGLGITTVSSEAEVLASRDEATFGETWAVVLDAEQAQAVEAWRRGDRARAQEIAQGNAARMRATAAAAPAAAPRLMQRAEAAEADMAAFEEYEPTSAEGRAYGLGSNAARRGRTR